MTEWKERAAAFIASVREICAGNLDDKDYFLREGRAIMRRVGKLMGVEFKVHLNKAGPAVSGDVILQGQNIYVMFSAWHGGVVGFMYRRVEDGKCLSHKYPNKWMEWGELMDLDQVARRLCWESGAVWRLER